MVSAKRLRYDSRNLLECDESRRQGPPAIDHCKAKIDLAAESHSNVAISSLRRFLPEMGIHRGHSTQGADCNDSTSCFVRRSDTALGPS